MTDLTPVFKAFAYFFATVLTAFFIPWLKRNTTAQDREEFLRWVEIAVAAAEQVFLSTQGYAKKEYVLGFLEEKGFTFSEEEINAAIEGAVLRLHKEIKG